jgi:hypothetical protein
MAGNYQEGDRPEYRLHLSTGLVLKISEDQARRIRIKVTTPDEELARDPRERWITVLPLDGRKTHMAVNLQHVVAIEDPEREDDPVTAIVNALIP